METEAMLGRKEPIENNLNPKPRSSIQSYCNENIYTVYIF